MQRSRILPFVILALLVIPAVFSLDVLRAAPGPQAARALALAFTSAFIRFGLWAVAAGLSFRLMARVPLALGARALAIHLGATLGLALGVSGLGFALQLLVRPGWLAALPAGGQVLAGSWAAAALLPEVGAAFVMSLPWDVLISWAVLAAVALAHQALRARDKAARALALASEVDEAHLAALETQLQPHFLFNALNTVSALLDSDARAARRVLRSLRRLFTRLLATQPDALTRLHDELALIRHYVAIERARFGDRLQVELDVPAACAHALVPSLLLQPLIENAIRHAAGARTGPIVVRLCALRRGPHLHLEVHDDGPGAPRSPLAGDGAGRRGLGLASTCARLQARYGQDQSFTFTPSAPPWGGAKVSITLPFETASPTAPERPRESAQTEAVLTSAARHDVPTWRFGWGLFALAMFVLNLLWSLARHHAAPTSFAATLIVGSRGALAWILLFPLVAATTALLLRAPLPATVTLPLHLLSALALAGLKAGLVSLLQQLGGPAPGPSITALIAARIYSDLLHYAVMAGICHALAHHARARAETARAARLEAELAAARLGALRLRLDPAWLQGSLATLESLVGHAPERAERLVAALGDRLRDLLAPLSPRAANAVHPAPSQGAGS